MSWKRAQTRARSGLAPIALRGVFRELGDDQRMVVGAGRLQLHAAEQRVVVVGEFEERDVGRALEEGFEHRQQADDGDAGEHAGQQAGGHLFQERDGRGLIDDADEDGKQGDDEAAREAARTTLPR